MTLQPILKTSKVSSKINNTSILSHIEQRLAHLGIPLDLRVRQEIAQYHSSQIMAALNHVEANYESIRCPKAVFLYQLPKQSIEKNKPLLPVYTATDFAGYTIEHMKAWYPTRWKEAALHFGISLT